MSLQALPAGAARRRVAYDRSEVLARPVRCLCAQKCRCDGLRRRDAARRFRRGLGLERRLRVFMCVRCGSVRIDTRVSATCVSSPRKLWCCAQRRQAEKRPARNRTRGRSSILLHSSFLAPLLSPRSPSPSPSSFSPLPFSLSLCPSLSLSALLSLSLCPSHFNAPPRPPTPPDPRPPKRSRTFLNCRRDHL